MVFFTYSYSMATWDHVPASVYVKALNYALDTTKNDELAHYYFNLLSFIGTHYKGFCLAI
jgi:hypothetical protein